MENCVMNVFSSVECFKSADQNWPSGKISRKYGPLKLVKNLTTFSFSND